MSHTKSESGLNSPHVIVYLVWCPLTARAMLRRLHTKSGAAGYTIVLARTFRHSSVNTAGLEHSRINKQSLPWHVSDGCAADVYMVVCLGAAGLHDVSGRSGGLKISALLHDHYRRSVVLSLCFLFSHRV